MLKPLNLADDAIWRQRFNTPTILWSAIASQNPSRGLICSNQDGVYQLYAWDTNSNALTQITHSPVGVRQGVIAASGQHIYYLHDDTGNELGHIVKVPFAGGNPEDISPALPDYATFYFTESHSGNVFGFCAAFDNQFQVHIVGDGNNVQHLSYESRYLSLGPNISHDGSIAVIATTEKKGTFHFSLEAYDINTGNKLNELWDGDGISINPIGFIPKAGDERFLATTTRTGFPRPFVWNPRTGERTALKVDDLAGDITPFDATEDGRYVLLRQLNAAKSTLHRYDLNTHTYETLNQAPAGSYANASYTRHGTIILNVQDSAHPSQLIEIDMATGAKQSDVLQAAEAPASHTWQSVTFATDDGTPIQAWLMTPDDDAPHPTIIHTHGGPSSVTEDIFKPEAQAWVDHGFAYMSINYRGSTTFGKDFQDVIIGNLGDKEVVDIAAGTRWLIEQGIAQEGAIFKTGGSYGGYLTLMALSKHPDLFAGGMAEIAIADWLLMYEDMNTILRSYAESLFGGTPETMREAYIAASPITYADHVAAPLLIINGRNDTRCPARQMEHYVTTLRDKGKDVTIDWFEAGHGSNATAQRIAHQERMLQFVYRVLGDER